MIIWASALAVMFGLSSPVASPAELLERRIYAEESQGDVRTAIEIYKSISAAADSERSVLGQALFRLGACYLKIGEAELAAASFQELRRAYPDQQALIAKIPGLPPVSLPLVDSPWESEETFLMRVDDWPINWVRPAVFRVVDGPSTTRIECRWSFGTTDIEADPKSFFPAHRLYVTRAITTEATFASGRVDFVRTQGGRTERIELRRPQPVYDVDQVLHLIRRLPLADGYTVSIHLLERATAAIHEARIDVLRREAVVVPAGTFEAFKVRIMFTDGYAGEDRSMAAPEGRTLWYSTDAQRYLVKIQSVFTWVLEEVRIGNSSAPSRLRDPSTGVVLESPDAWFIVGEEHGDPLLQAALVEPKGRAQGIVRRVPLSKDNALKDPEQIAIAHATHRRQSDQEYTVTAREPFGGHGVAGVRLIAETGAETGPKYVEYAVFIVHAAHQLSIVFDPIAKGGQWDELKPQIDRIVNTLRLQ